MARFTQGGGSGEGSALNYVQVAGQQVTVSSAPASIIDLDITTTGKPVQISVTGEGSNASAGSWVRVNLFRGNTAIGNEIQIEASDVSENVPYAINFIDNVAGGTYNYSARVTTKSSGNWTFGEVTGPVMNAVELTGFKGDDGTAGTNGTNGTNGADGADALWNFTGAYDGGAAYAVGDIATYNGQTWYRVNSNGGNVGDTPSAGLWTLIADKGADGTDASGGVIYLGNYISGNGYIADIAVVRGSDNNLYIAKSNGGLADPVGNTTEWDIFSDNTAGSADIANFVFTGDSEESTMSIANHDMIILTTREEPGSDADISIQSADDIWIDANGDELALYAANQISFRAGDPEQDPMTYIDGTVTLPNQSKIFDAAETVFVPKAITVNSSVDALGNAPEGYTATSVILPWTQDGFDLAQAFFNARAASGTITFGDSTSASLITAFDTVYETYPAIIYQFADTLPIVYPVTVNALFDHPEYQKSLNVRLLNLNGNDTPTVDWRFDNDGKIVGPSGVVTTNAIATNNLSVQDAGQIFEDSGLVIQSNSGYGIALLGNQNIEIVSSSGDILLSADGNVYKGSSVQAGNEVINQGRLDQYIGDNTVDGSTGNTIADRINAAGGGGSANLGDFQFNAGTATVNDNETLLIQANNADTVKSQLVLDPNNGIAKLEAFDNPNVTTFYASNPDWDSATWASDGGTGSVITFVNTPNILNWIATSSLSVYNASMVINGVPAGTVNGFSYNGTDITLYINNTVPTEDPTVNEIGFAFVTSSFIDINYDNGSFDIEANNMDVTIKSDDDIYITAGGDDLFLRANDDIRFTARYNEPGMSEQQWTMNSEGQLHFPGVGYIENVIDGSGDGNGYDTFKIVPDDDLVSGNGSDQYLIIDPTSPNHIHIRAGGTQDASTAHLILGGEKNNVEVSDVYSTVSVHTKQGSISNEYQNLNTESSSYIVLANSAQADYGYEVNVDGIFYPITLIQNDAPEVGLKTIQVDGATFTPNNWYEFRYQPDGTYNWSFNPNGLLLGPSQGTLLVTGLDTLQNFDLTLSGQNAVVLTGNTGEFLNDSNVAGNQIATVTDVANYAPVETSFTVNGGTTATQPTFDGAPLFSGTYVKIGPQVHFQIQVDMDNILTFGTGQYYVDLPFDAKYGYQFKEGCLHDISTSNQFAIGGHVAAGTNRLFLTYTGSNGQDEMFDFNSPATLNVEDNFHIAGTYISA